MSKSTKTKKPDAGQRGASRLSATVANLIHRVQQCTDDAFAKEARDIDLTQRQLIVLEAISTMPGASQSRLCEATGIDRSTLAEIMRRMVLKRVVARRRSREDARTYVIELAEAGRDMLRQAYPIATKVEQRITDILGSRKTEELARMLDKVVQGFQR
jgi:DNA-binding MarR family transcriptional regulator